MAMSPAQRSFARKMATVVASSAVATLGGAQGPSNAGAASAYELQLAELGSRLLELKQIQSIELKIARKRELIADFDPWVAGVLDAHKAGAPAVQDEVLLVMMIWALDIEDYDRALPLVMYVLTNHLALPERYTRTAPTLIAEESANAALQHLGQGEPVHLPWLQLVDELTADADMHDQVRAKLHKAIALAVLRDAEEAEKLGDGPAGGWKAAGTAALTMLKSALRLNSNIGVKKTIENVERKLNALAG
ncbi:MAG: phage terminase small subunit [Pseudomonadota bacterium]